MIGFLRSTLRSNSKMKLKAPSVPLLRLFAKKSIANNMPIEPNASKSKAARPKAKIQDLGGRIAQAGSSRVAVTELEGQPSYSVFSFDTNQIAASLHRLELAFGGMTAVMIFLPNLADELHHTELLSCLPGLRELVICGDSDTAAAWLPVHPSEKENLEEMIFTSGTTDSKRVTRTYSLTSGLYAVGGLGQQRHHASTVVGVVVDEQMDVREISREVNAVRCLLAA